jgi:CPA2 family monovalent cation:H+ antiporter-2
MSCWQSLLLFIRVCLAGTINIAAYSDALVVLGTAGVVVPLVKRLGVSPVLAYLVAGALLGPRGLGSFVPSFPPLYWVTVVDEKNVSGLADLGVVFLLFLIGLELSFERLRAMRRLVVGLGGLQVALSTLVIAVGLTLAGAPPPIAIVIGGCLALSSTAIVIELLAKQGRLSTSTGRASFSILLAQDLAVIPLLMLISILGGDASGPMWVTVTTALGQAVLAVAIIVLLGRVVLRPLLRSVVQAQSSELFMAAILFVIVATGLVAAQAGLSMALGAFVAGLLLAETEYRKSIEATLEPFKSLLLGLFFFTVGMAIDVREFWRAPMMLLGSVAALIAVKSTITWVLCRIYRQSPATSVETALVLGPGGEFALVGFALASATGVLAPATATFAVTVTALSMLLIPWLAATGLRLRTRFEEVKAPDPALAEKPGSQTGHAIVIGVGRVGRVVLDLLETHKVPTIAVDQSPAAVTAARGIGRTAYLGEATNVDFLRACGISSAAGVVITMHTQSLIDDVVAEVRRLRPDIPIVARARDAAHARHLYAIGVTDAVPETIEASLQLSEAVLVGLGIPVGPVIASIHDKRDVFRAELQLAAQALGRTETRSIKEKSSQSRGQA